MAAIKGRLGKVFGQVSLWPLWAILVIGGVLLAGRGCAPGPQNGATSAVATATTTVAVSPSAGSSAEPGAGPGAPSPATPRTSVTRGPAGTPTTATERSVARCDIDRLPPQARRTVDLVRSGGPFPYPRNDGVLFRNSERLLPAKAQGYYREYTVETPGADTRATRRIVTGGEPATDPPQWYYTGDHYQSFCRITGL